MVSGTNPPAGWASLTFDDAAWPEGRAKLGYGEGDEATEVSFGPNSTNKYITTYFRQSFGVANAGDFNALFLQVQRDDGVVVYLNGTQVFKSNMPSGTVGYSTLAATNVTGNGEDILYPASFGASRLEDGTNVLAAEIHQFSRNSPDISFDLRLAASNSLQRTRGPYLQSGTPDSVIVRWRTSVPADSSVSYGTNVDDLDRSIVYATDTTEHQVRLTGLLPDTKYFYAIGSASTIIASGADYFFVTPPLGAKPTRIWVIGDSGTADANAEAVRDAYYTYAENRYTDLWLMLGDNAYFTGTDEQYQAAVFDMYPEILRQTALWPTIGNHDTAFSTDPPPTLPYFNIFTLPTQGEAGGVPSGTEKYYSYNYGNIHFAVLDAMSSDRTSNGPMCAWLQADLAANTNDWLIAYWHHPPYTKGSHDSDIEIELIEMRENVVPILESYGADLVLCGHSHCYERSYLMNGHYGNSDSLMPSMILDNRSGCPDETGPYIKPSVGPVSNRGTVYAVAGSSGQISPGTFDHPAMFVSLMELGSMVLDIDGQTLEAKFLRENGVIQDCFRIVKGGTPAFRITAISIAEDMLTLSWNSSEQMNYRVQRATDLDAPMWTTISPDIAGNASSTSWSHPLTGPPGNAFYRILSFPD